MTLMHNSHLSTRWRLHPNMTLRWCIQYPLNQMLITYSTGLTTPSWNSTGFILWVLFMSSEPNESKIQDGQMETKNAEKHLEGFRSKTNHLPLWKEIPWIIQAYSFLRWRGGQIFCFPNECKISVSIRSRRPLSEEMVAWTILQMVQATSEDKEVLGYYRKCCTNTNLCCNNNC